MVDDCIFSSVKLDQVQKNLLDILRKKIVIYEAFFNVMKKINNYSGFTSKDLIDAVRAYDAIVIEIASGLEVKGESIKTIL